ncbi:MAG: excinuclease ABC subunit UvrB [Candidatus Thermoplasmatota archaeon]|nr:excinuclease ABC subunit UvrB [Candidatus Thermoplasmatota archaeon]MEE3083380.1 excinuclease ABC subunit UvrB [Candidatus Thermoplasmatota archaeon]
MTADVDPFDLSKALEGAAKAHLDPSISKFELHAEYGLAGDQNNAIEKTLSQLRNSQSRCVMLGVTGSGKTFAMANIIEALNIPTLILSHNKTLSRQLWQEMSGLFPNNAVEYFVSHYDYYQPEAYLPKRDLYIEKELSLNERIEQERFSTVASLVSRPDVLVVATVSAIYGLNPPETFLQQHARLHVDQQVEPYDVVKQLVALQYRRVTGEISRGELRLRGEVLDIWMPSRDDPIRIRFDLDGITRIDVCEPVSWEPIDEIEEVWIHPKEFFMTGPDRFEKALDDIEFELQQRLDFFEKAGMDLEAHRLESKTRYDLDMLREIGHCRSVENYSMHFDGRTFGERPYCLLDFFAACAQTFHGSKEKFLVIMDESHVTLPQLGGMYHGDRSRKENLIEHGFRLPSAADNRPLMSHEFQSLVPQMLYMSATPGERELKQLCETTGQPVHEPDPKAKRKPLLKDALGEIKGISRMEIRPTGLLDPALEVRPTEGQVQNLLDEITACTQKNERVLVTVMTIKFAEEVSDYLQRMGVKAHYLHSEIDTLERSEIIKALRIGHIDVIVGINLLREGLDIPEVSLVAIFDADKEGFLRNERSLLQTIGRASRNENGRVILYADTVGRAMDAAISQTIERRQRQIAYNEEHGITPKTIQKPLPVMGIEAEQLLAGTAGKGISGGKRFVGGFKGQTGKEKDPSLIKKFNLGAGSWGDDIVSNLSQPNDNDISDEEGDSGKQLIRRLRKEMNQSAARLDFEKAAHLRDRIFQLENSKSN